MELLALGWDILIHLERYLSAWLAEYGVWFYAILFVVIFCETGLVVWPFLPGDSLLFVVGTLAASAGLNVTFIIALIVAAALCGDNVNYWIGRWLGPRVFHFRESRLFNPKHLERTHAFYDRHGGKTVVIARFIPIVRTFAPFVAGIGRMFYPRFLAFSVGGAVLWSVSLVGAGYLIGNIPTVKNNLTVVIVAIVAISLTPMAFEWLRVRRQR
jgi:membrane-associated protein